MMENAGSDISQHPIQIRMKDAEGGHWSGLIHPANDSDRTIKFQLKSEEKCSARNISLLFPYHSDLTARTGPHHIAILKKILLTFTPTFGGISDGHDLPIEIKGICHELVLAPTSYRDKKDQIISATFAADVLLDIIGTRLHNLSEDWNSCSRQAGYKRTIESDSDIALHLKFFCALESTRFGATKFSDQCTVTLAFNRPYTHNEAIAAVIRTRLLFSFLTAIPLPPTEVSLAASNGSIGRTIVENPYSGKESRLRDYPLWTQSNGPVAFEDVWKTFQSAPIRFVSFMAATLFCLHKSRNLDDRSLATFPNLEKLLSSEFNHPDEDDYIKYRDGFFSYLDERPEFKAFAQKHVKVIDRKEPSLGKRIKRLADHLNKIGAEFPSNTGSLLSRIRNTRFHTNSSGVHSDEYYQGQIAATALMALRTFEMLGIPPSSLAKGAIIPAELRKFLQGRDSDLVG